MPDVTTDRTDSGFTQGALLSVDRSRELTPRELVHVLLFGIVSDDYVQAMRRFLTLAVR